MVDTSRGALVVGAGFAGLSAAVDLVGRGVTVTVLEARDRVGGRVWSVRLTNGEVAELGAEWIMPGDDALLDLVARYPLEAVETGVDYELREARGSAAASLAEQLAFLESAREARSRIPADEATGLSLGRFLDSLEGSDAQLATLRVRLQGTCATDLDRVALRVTEGERAFATGGGPYRRFTTGNQSLADAMASSLDIRLGTRVDRIDHDRDGVLVRAGSEGFRGSVVVVALPVRVAARLRFEPALPDDLAIALRELPMGVASKLAVATDAVQTLRSIQSADLPFWCWVANGSDGPRRCLTSFAGSEVAQEELRTSAGDPGPWLEHLARLNPDLAFVGPARMKSWADDPLTMGAYSAWDNRSWDRLEQFQRTVGRVAFAGEHTAGPNHYGTMNGAILSGRRAASQALDILG